MTIKEVLDEGDARVCIWGCIAPIRKKDIPSYTPGDAMEYALNEMVLEFHFGNDVPAFSRALDRMEAVMPEYVGFYYSGGKYYAAEATLALEVPGKGYRIVTHTSPEPGLIRPLPEGKKIFPLDELEEKINADLKR